MYNFCVLGEKVNNFFSSSIIVNNLNIGARNMGLFDENGPRIVYSTVGSDYGHENVVAIMCLYELPFPVPVLSNLKNRPMIGTGLDNMFFGAEGGYPRELCHSVALGVDTEIFRPRKKKRGTFRFLSFAESNSRCGLHLLIPAFGEAFGGFQDVELYIKDRFATDVWKTWVKEQGLKYNVKIIHDTEHTQNIEGILDIYAQSDVHVFLNQSSTWALSCVEGMAMGLPLISMAYSGPANYLRDQFNGFAVPYTIEEVSDEHLQGLVKIGLRNFLFQRGAYLTTPYWAEPNLAALKDAMVTAKDNPALMDSFSSNAILTATQFSWERAAVNLSQCLYQIEKNRKNSYLNRNFARYE